MVTPIFDNEIVLCELDDALPVLRHSWKRSPTPETFKTTLLKILSDYERLSQSYNNLAWLADTTELGEVDEETEDWLVDEWENELFVRAGVKIHAVILGESIFADYPMENFQRDAEEKFHAFDVHLGVFSNENDAYKWIKDQQLLIAK